MELALISKTDDLEPEPVKAKHTLRCSPLLLNFPYFPLDNSVKNSYFDFVQICNYGKCGGTFVPYTGRSKFNGCTTSFQLVMLEASFQSVKDRGKIHYRMIA
ncbi:MAG: hypothetical protein ONB05_08905 [candidate division KSB1 bacterium]|nr:hypothetical protein [candidate division KSB1 bacterium]